MKCLEQHPVVKKSWKPSKTEKTSKKMAIDIEDEMLHPGKVFETVPR